MDITLYTGGFAQTNGYLIETADGNILIDAPEGITEWFSKRGTCADVVLLTHQHYDHVLDAAALQEKGAKLYALEEYSKNLTLENAARGWGMPISVPPYQVDHRFNLNQTLQLCGFDIGLAHVPGHSTDSVTFHFSSEATLFSGDTLFAGTVGRADLPEGNMDQLLKGIVTHLMALSGTTQVFPGHGPSTTIAKEAKENPYLT
jgi:hydroxyacylglutathione hydrolase